MKDVSFVIVNYGTMHLVGNLIRSVRTYTKADYEIILVDNDEDSGHNTAAPQFEADIIYISVGRNIGFGAANNLGAKAAGGRYLFFLNPDTRLLNDAAEVFVRFMDDPANCSVGCCGGDLVTDNMEKQVCYGNFPSLAGVVAELGFYRFFRRAYRQRLALAVQSNGSKPKTVDYISGADLFVRREVFERLGGFDIDFFLYFEETDLAFRMKKFGYEIMLIPSVRIVHLEGGAQASNTMVNLAKARFFEPGRLMFFRKARGKGVARIVKLLLALQALVRAGVHWHRDYLKLFSIIVKS